MSTRSGDGAVGVGLIGFGTIGTGVARVLRQNRDVIAERLGFPLRLARIADLDTETDRGVDLDGIAFDADAQALIEDPEVEIVIELIGGYGAAKTFTLEAIQLGKSVVTANKALLAVHGKEIFEAAAKAGVDVAFEASVGGGIPVLRALREGLSANRILSVQGILNGTTNYVLTEMETTGEDFDVVLKRAQDLGYAEADPAFDVDGIDAAHKLSLLAAMAFGAEFDFEDIPTEGIRGLLPIDFELADELGYRIKMLGIAKDHNEGDEPRLEARVHPTMIPKQSLLASVDGSMNAVMIKGDAVGPTLYYGAGAGELPTASAVVSDLMELARELRRGASGRVPPLSYTRTAFKRKQLVPQCERRGRFYLRFSVPDEPGVLSILSSALGDKEIGIESVLQKGRRIATESVSVIVLTHPAPEGAVRDVLREIDAWPSVSAATHLIRIEEEE